ncbi:hypothetical protein V1286_005732 [Bradyrhizobium algeriense]|uniref:Uncharacterized protein n=1 Tax=Bradyrhizobium algeriense TaxID=634784 RepID=A0ABU8BJQ0_9BRAD
MVRKIKAVGGIIARGRLAEFLIALRFAETRTAPR